ncbi:cell envelope integrity protein TolA [Croceimicrobium sp.]|uniref:cell envelope integrity protein TolA n=1 Tax=Croceimicrobium sp. TaxID=2828340 RepID=UPI003BABB9EF
MNCIKQEGTSYRNSCLGNGLNNNSQSAATSYITNLCDEPVDVYYHFEGEWIDSKDNPISPGKHQKNRVANNIKPGKRVRIYFCETRKNSGHIVIDKVVPAGQSSSFSSSGSGSSGSSGSFGSGTNSSGASSNSSSSSGSSANSNSDSDPIATMTNSIMQKSGGSTSSGSYNSGSSSSRRSSSQNQSQSSGNSRLDRERRIQQQHKEHVEASRRNSAAAQQRTANKRQSTAQAEQQRKAAEAARKQAEYERQKRKAAEEARKRQEYAQWKNQQNQKNAQAAAAAAATTVTLLAVLGREIYKNMGVVDFDQVYRDKPSFYASTEYGYSFLLHPIYFNSEVYDGVRTSNNTDYDFAWPLNFDFKAKIGFESPYFGGYGFGGMGIGTSLLFHSFNFPSYQYGGQVHAGIPNAKFLFAYEAGGRALTNDYWLLVEESGSGFTDLAYGNIKYGARFSWGSFTRSHLSLGVIYENVAGANEDIKVQRINVEGLDQTKTYFIPGYFLEYKKDHSFNFFLHFYPNYPFSGEVNYGFRGGEDYDDGSIYLYVGFLRSLDFYK